MSDILSPQGLEPNEALQDTDIQEVYQPTSGGIRRNKQSTLATLKAFFQKLTSFTGNNIMESDGTGNPRTTSIATSAVQAAITNTAANSIELTDKINQGVKTIDTPTFSDATIGGHAVGAELSTLNGRVNQDVRSIATPEFADINITGLTGTVEDRIETNTSDIVTVNGRVDGNDTDIATLNGRVNQDVRSIATPEFADINITGLTGTVEDRIETNTSDIIFTSKGLNNVLLSNYTGTSAPEIISGSQVDIAGVLYVNGLNVTIAGATVNDTWYDILLTPSGPTFTASYIARGTGVWSDLHKGLYSGANRVVATVFRDGSGNFISKNVLIVNNRTVEIKIEIGDWNMVSTSIVSIAHGLLDHTKIRTINAMIINDSGANIFDFTYNNEVGSTVASYDWSMSASTTGINLIRAVTGGFNSASFDSTSYNRGWIKFTYEV